MKTNITVFAVAAALTLAFFSLPASAGDDPVQQLVLPADGGVDAVCSTLLHPKVNYAAQPEADSYVSISATGDGGAGVATSANVLVGTNKLYDTPTTATQRYICCKRAAASTTAANCKILLHREGAE